MCMFYASKTSFSRWLPSSKLVVPAAARPPSSSSSADHSKAGHSYGSYIDHCIFYDNWANARQKLQ